MVAVRTGWVGNASTPKPIATARALGDGFTEHAAQQ
jgi:hypothetical protein